MKLIMLLFLAVILTGCSSYGGKFKSSPARGVYSIPVGQIDELITTGDIDEITIDRKKQRKFKK